MSSKNARFLLYGVMLGAFITSLALSCREAQGSQQLMENVPDVSEGKRPRVDVQFYHIAFNSELFDLPCCSGFTILGTQSTAALYLPLGEHAEVRVGAFASVRSTEEPGAFERIRPIVSLIIERGANRFIMGTLDTEPRIPWSGPEFNGRHGLLPPLQSFTVGLERGYENGLQYIHDAPNKQIDIWVNWQTLNTSEQRETFDGGIVTRERLYKSLWGAVQGHVVHDGGQLGGNTPVSDSWAFGTGLLLIRRRPKLFLVAGPRLLDEITNEFYILNSSTTPDREKSWTQVHGVGYLYRSTIRYRGFRGQVTRWWGDDWVKREGDGLYQSDVPGWSPWKKYMHVGAFYEYRPSDAPLDLEMGVRIHRSRIHEPLVPNSLVQGWQSRTTTDYEYFIRAIIDLSFGL